MGRPCDLPHADNESNTLRLPWPMLKSRLGLVAPMAEAEVEKLLGRTPLHLIMVDKSAAGL
jgi:hypothetical protein